MRKITQIKKRVMAFALCAVMTLTSNVVVFAEGEVVPNVEEYSVPVVEETLTPAVEETEIVSEESSEIVEESTEVVAVEAAEESVVIAEESVAATEESVVIAEESVAATEESVVIAEESVAATEESVVIAEESDAAAEESVVTNEKVSTTVESSVEATEKKTVETTEKTTATIDGSVVTTEDTIEIVLQILNYEDDDVKIHVEEVTEEAIPNGVSLKVTPITAADKEYTNVEQQLNEKAEGEEYEIAGFLAYDITFVDKDGNKVEPNGGVKVTMEYKEAILPEVVKEAEPAALDVTVMHFEEDANGEVKEVVDMVAATDIEAEVKTTENAEVEKAEFVTDSFSIYTITWTSTENETPESREIQGTIVTITGETFDVTNKVMNLPASVDSDVINISDLNFEGFNDDGTSYVFHKVVACQGASYSNAGSIDVTSINYLDGSYRANNNEDYVITNSEEGYSLYFVYLKANTIATVDSKAYNINVSVFDYSRYNEKLDHDKVLRNINDNHSLKFVTSGTEWGMSGYNTWTGNGGGPKQDIVKSNLNSSGVPVLKAAGESLGYLFEKGYSTNYLFKKDGGYYVYRSTDNFAELDASTGNFTVYENDKKGFFPFNNYSDNIQIQGAGSNTITNHHFGMHVNFTFMQPKGGKVDGQNMVFEFSGDDDVWVFIDGMLVLDLGGIHEKTGGSIDFATGKVDYDHNGTQDTTIRAMFIEALQEQGKTLAEATALADEYFVQDGQNYVFKDYSQHELDFFYLERGAYDSNCEIKFNLISIPKDSVTVEKEISNYGEGAYSDVEFSFNMYLQNGEKDGTAAGNDDPKDTLVTGAQYVHVAADGKTKTTKTIGADGVFKLKHKEEAVFSHLDVNTKFYVVETGITQETYDKVEIVGSGVLNESGADIASDQNSISSKTLEIGTDAYVLFQNRCAATNMKYLSIEKDFDESGKLEGNPDYTFRVTLGGALYSGDYKVGGSYTDALSSATVLTTTDGIIKLKNGEVAVILGNAESEDGKVVGIPSETTFKVEEINLDLQTYVPAKYEVTDADDIEVVNKRNGWGSGKINIGYNAHVKVTNALKQAEDTPEIKVSKTFAGLTQEQIDNLANNFEITVNSKDITPAVSRILKLTENGITKTTDENGDITYTWTLVNYPAGTYTVSEKGETVDEYENVIKVNGNTVTSNTTFEVTTTAATLEYDPNATTKETSCNVGTYTVGNVNLIVAQLTSNEGYFVWTRERISINERLAIVQWINDVIGFSPKAELEKCYFYSDDISDTLYFREGEIKYDGTQYLTFDDSNQWSMFATGNYTVVGGDAAEIVFENNYTPLTVDMDLKKESVSGPELEGAEFALYKYNVETSAWDVVENYGQVAVTNKEGSTKELVGLKAGRYKLVETKAPAGYFLLADAIYFEVENATVELTDADGKTLTANPDMWTLDAQTKVLTVKNDVLYELPSTGGSGIHLYTIGGTVLMAGAALILYKNKRKEVL